MSEKQRDVAEAFAVEGTRAVHALQFRGAGCAVPMTDHGVCDAARVLALCRYPVPTTTADDGTVVADVATMLAVLARASATSPDMHAAP